MEIEFESILNCNKELIELVRNWRNSEQVRPYMYTDHYISKEEHCRWLEKLRTENTAKAWIIKYNGTPLGLVSLSNIDYENKTTEWGFYIADESVRGKGIGSATLYRLMKYVFEDMKLNKMQTMVLENNKVALNLYRKFGFVKDEKLKKEITRNGGYLEVITMMFLKDDWKEQKMKLKEMAK